MNSGLKFQWKKDAKWQANNAFFLPLVIHNVPNGVRKVEQLVNNKWVETDMFNGFQGLIYTIRSVPFPGVSNREVQVRVFDAQGARYGEWKIKFECDVNGSCTKNVEAKADKVG